MISVPCVNEKRVQNYVLAVTEPLREDSLNLDQIKSFCEWFNRLIRSEVYEKNPDEVALVAQKPIAALGVYNQSLATLVLNRNKWVGNIDKVVLNDVDLVGIFGVLQSHLGYSDEKLVDFVDAMVRLIAESNHSNECGLTEYLDKPLEWHISGDR